MRVLVIAAGVIAGLATAAVADPSSLLAPADPAHISGWKPPPAATDGLETFAPVEAKNWLELNRTAGSTQSGSMDGTKDVPGVKGRDGKCGMEGMPEMERGR